MLRSLGPASQRQYESCWRRFKEFLRSQSSPIISEELVLEFLCWLAREGNRAPATVSAHFAALKDPLRFCCNISVDDRALPMVRRGLRSSIPRSRPSNVPWSLHKVPEFLSRDQVSEQPLCFFLRETLFLVALAAGFRSSQLAALTCHPSFLSFRSDLSSVSLSPSTSFLAKNERSDCLLQPMTLPTIPASDLIHVLYPVSSLISYMAVTAGASPDHIFYHHSSRWPLLPRSMASLICGVIREADPETSPMANSARGLAASLAFLGTHSLDGVKGFGGWAYTTPFGHNCLFHAVSTTQCVAFGTMSTSVPTS